MGVGYQGGEAVQLPYFGRLAILAKKSKDGSATGIFCRLDENAMPLFEEEYPSRESYWRAIVLFGQNVASYKFALANSLLGLAEQQKTLVTLEELAQPFSEHIVNHLKLAEKQSTSRSSRFLEACKGYIEGRVSKEQLLEATVRRGFNNVIDAFHIVGRAETAVRFFVDKRAGRNKRIRLTDELLSLVQEVQKVNLPHEVDARWRLVETAWKLNVSRNLITVQYEPQARLLFTTDSSLRRVSITSCRKALN